MMDIENVLKKYGFKKKLIERFKEFYNYAIEHKIIYPFYYALMKTKLFDNV